MPYISIESGKLTAEQKKQLIERLTATASEIAHIPAQFFVITIKEIPDENFGFGSKSIDKIKRNYTIRNENLSTERGVTTIRALLLGTEKL
ncbi:MAG: tautomerase family protein [Muribaculaceae bacterium]|nr:tautomerase family protein [Muribaculaceae bacterium]